MGILSVGFSLFCFSILFSIIIWAQNLGNSQNPSAKDRQESASSFQTPSQLNLDDVQIKGEATGSKLLSISARKKNNISERVSLKSSLIPDILESLPEGFSTAPSSEIKKNPKTQ